MNPNEKLAYQLTAKAQDAARQLFPERVARAMVDALRGPERVAFVQFDTFGRAYAASPFHPGSWLSRTVRYGLDGSAVRVI